MAAEFALSIHECPCTSPPGHRVKTVSGVVPWKRPSARAGGSHYGRLWYVGFCSSHSARYPPCSAPWQDRYISPALVTEIVSTFLCRRNVVVLTGAGLAYRSCWSPNLTMQRSRTYYLELRVDACSSAQSRIIIFQSSVSTFRRWRL